MAADFVELVRLWFRDVQGQYPDELSGVDPEQVAQGFELLCRAVSLSGESFPFTLARRRAGAAGNG